MPNIIKSSTSEYVDIVKGISRLMLTSITLLIHCRLNVVTCIDQYIWSKEQEGGLDQIVCSQLSCSVQDSFINNVAIFILTFYIKP